MNSKEFVPSEGGSTGPVDSNLDRTTVSDVHRVAGAGGCEEKTITEHYDHGGNLIGIVKETRFVPDSPRPALCDRWGNPIN